MRSTTVLPPFATADLMDEYGALASCQAQFRHYGGRVSFHGAVATVRCHEDNGLVRAAVAEPGRGRVLVVDGGGSLRTALVGDNVARLAADNGWAGIVVNGAVRDVLGLARVDIGVCALGTNPRRPSRTGAGSAGVPVACGGVVFLPGNPLFADGDGVVTGPPDTLPLLPSDPPKEQS
ncbi:MULTISPECIES: ribonuclease E activity regulator RraA [unclassified Nocardiopsis]|uniref:ribonuclease E activity regulator RraA n=1 Tax=unclassified Nocardiopsis TaxID=2649073 RepID=UPI00135C378A|nr:MULTISPECIES: ribonuclease E activity regulator RraA [unclassified Nocardiopsis]